MWPLKSGHAHFLRFCLFVRVCVWAWSTMHGHLCVRICVCVGRFIFMNHALPSHTVGVSRSSSLTINHRRQLISAKSACERTACACIWTCEFDYGRVVATVLQDVAAYWNRSEFWWYLYITYSMTACIFGGVCTAATTLVTGSSTASEIGQSEKNGGEQITK